MLAMALGAGCGSGSVAEPPPPASLGWVDAVAADPSAFEALVAADRDGWIALHAHDAASALRAFADQPGGAGARRAALARSIARGDLATLTADAAARLASAWGARAAGQGAAPVPPAVRAAGSLAADCAALSLPDDAPPALRDGVAAHARGREQGDLDALERLAAAPIWRSDADGFERVVWDPCLPASAAAAWRARAGEGAIEGLGGAFLAAWGTADELAAGLAAGVPAGELGPDGVAAALGVTGPGDDAEDARRRVSALVAATDAVAERIIDRAPPEGAALATELGLVGRWREQLCLAMARRALRLGSPDAAAVWARAATFGRDGLPTDPSAPLLLATAELRSGRAREALAALPSSAGADPALRAAVDPLSDLVVLEGLGRAGDSKEDP
jgi:hypothetical protein